MSTLVMVIDDEQEEESQALEKARDIAERLGAGVQVVKFIPTSASAELEHSTSQSIAHLVESVFSEFTRVSSQVVSNDNIADWMAGQCDVGADNIVVKTGHRSESLIHTPTDWSLIRHLHCPLLISSSQKWKSQPNVLVALDLSTEEAEHRELNFLALQSAREWRNATGCQLHAAYSLPIAKPLLALDIVERRDYQHKHEPAAQHQLKALLLEAGIDDIQTHILAGPPNKTIPHLANELKADMVIMGSLGREGFQALLKGNTAEKVLHHLRTDMLIVKPTGMSL